jgi:N-acetylneuraminic acid mutarotase
MKYSYIFLFTLAISLVANYSHAQIEEWVEVAPIPEGRHHPVTWGFDDEGYVVTGSNTFNNPTRDFYRYDPSTDTWETLDDFPGGPRSFSIGVTYNGKGYLGFGASLTQYYDDLWEYDPETDTWTELPSCPCTGRRHPSFVINDGRLFVGLGDGAPGNLNDWWEYNIETEQWTQHDNLPGQPRHHPFQFSAGSHAYAGMGHGGSFIYDDWYKFNMETDSWETMTPFPGEARVAGAQFDYRGDGYIISGDGSDHDYMEEGEFWKYDDDNDSWEELTPHPGISKWAPGAMVIHHKLYFVAGQNRQTGVNTNNVWMYDFGIPAGQNKIAKENIEIYPNPVKDQLNVKGESLEQITIMDLTGKVVIQRDLRTQSIDLSNLDNGSYLVEIKDVDGKIFTDKLIKM